MTENNNQKLSISENNPNEKHNELFTILKLMIVESVIMVWLVWCFDTSVAHFGGKRIIFIGMLWTKKYLDYFNSNENKTIIFVRENVWFHLIYNWQICIGVKNEE